MTTTQKIIDREFFLISGPCVVEDRDLCMRVAEHMVMLTTKFNLPYIFKASYRKANRSSASSFQGIGDEKALRILEEVKNSFSIPVTTDVHDEREVAMVATVVDVIQIPAFLCRQTSLLQAAGYSGRIVNIKKGQFMSGPSMHTAVEKVKLTGNDHIWLTERGNFYGYEDLVVDFRNLVWMREAGVPVIMDCTHSLQQPNQSSGVTGGRPQLITTMAKAAVAVGVQGLFIETHPYPAQALSDGANMLPLSQMEPLLKQVMAIYQTTKNF